MSVPISVRPGTHKVETVSADISASGIYFLLPERVEIGSQLGIEFALSPLIAGSRVLVCCRGMVVRVDESDAPGRIGVAVRLETCEFVRARAA